jgi:hypothetical protein
MSMGLLGYSGRLGKAAIVYERALQEAECNLVTAYPALLRGTVEPLKSRLCGSPVCNSPKSDTSLDGAPAQQISA